MDNKKIEKKIITFADGSEAFTIGNVQIQRGTGKEEPKKVEVIDNIEDNDFRKAIENPDKFKFDRITRKVRARRKNEKAKN